MNDLADVGTDDGIPVANYGPSAKKFRRTLFLLLQSRLSNDANQKIDELRECFLKFEYQEVFYFIDYVSSTRFSTN